ncbi:MAG: hypothetical protein IJX77_09270, partial [Ruminococcus sp.]|nr:hypothetical protein [Ruminococcus sp.]
MKKFIRNTFALLLSGAMLVSAVGCSEDETSSYQDEADLVGNLQEEDMPYGATMTQIKPSQNDKVKIAVEYDYRFLTDEEAIKVSDYMAALGTGDAALMDATVYPPYMQRLCSNNGVSDTQEYIDLMRENLVNNYMGGEFEFTYVLIDEMVEDADEAGFSTLDSILESLGVGEITSKKLVKIDCMYSLEGDSGSYALSYRTGGNQAVYIYT